MNESEVTVLDLGALATLAEPTTESVDEDLLSKLSLYCACLMNLMCMVGILGNSVSIYIFTRSFNKRYTGSINVLLSALSSSDLCVCILAVPVFSISQLQSLMPSTPELTATVMLYFYPVCLMAQTMSVWMLVVITIDRYLAVCHPFAVRRYCTKKRAFFAIAIILIFSIAYNFVRFWEFTLNETPSDEVNDLVQPLLRADKMFMLWYQNVLTLVTQFVLPLVVLCWFNSLVTRTILKAGEQRRELVSSERREHSTAKMMLFVVLVFIFCYTFSFTLNVLEILNEGLFQSPVGYFLNDVNNILVILNSSTSFIFYYKYSSKYRSQLKAMFSLDHLIGRPWSGGRNEKKTTLSECSQLVTTAIHTPNGRSGQRHSTTVLSVRGSNRGTSFYMTSPRWSNDGATEEALMNKFTETNLIIVQEP